MINGDCIALFILNRPANTDFYSGKVTATQFGNKGTDTVVPAASSSGHRLDPTKVKIQIVMEHQNVRQGYLVKPGQGSNKPAGAVHEGERFAAQNNT